MNSSVEKKAPSPLDEKKKRQREWVISELRKKIPQGDGPGCFVCKLIVEDLDLHGKLTGYPLDAMGSPTFLRSGKIDHLRLEGFLIPLG